MSNLENALRELREKRSGMQMELEKLNQIISGIESLNGAGSRTLNHGPRAASPAVTKAPARRILSAAARRKISLAQKARWARQNADNQGKPTRRKHTISAAGRSRIAAAARARWAKVRALKKTA